jgi:hypothetical protein
MYVRLWNFLLYKIIHKWNLGVLNPFFIIQLEIISKTRWKLDRLGRKMKIG